MKNVGIDIVKNNRFIEMLNDERKCARILSKKEMEVFLLINHEKRKLEYIASRFAAKEALFKALNKSEIKFDYNRVSILNDETRAPYVEFEIENDLNILISISHSDDDSIAIVIIN